MPAFESKDQRPFLRTIGIGSRPVLVSRPMRIARLGFFVFEDDFHLLAGLRSEGLQLILVLNGVAGDDEALAVRSEDLFERRHVVGGRRGDECIGGSLRGVERSLAGRGRSGSFRLLLGRDADDRCEHEGTDDSGDEPAFHGAHLRLPRRRLRLPGSSCSRSRGNCSTGRCCRCSRRSRRQTRFRRLRRRASLHPHRHRRCGNWRPLRLRFGNRHPRRHRRCGNSRWLRLRRCDYRPRRPSGCWLTRLRCGFPDRHDWIRRTCSPSLCSSKALRRDAGSCAASCRSRPRCG